MKKSTVKIIAIFTILATLCAMFCACNTSTKDTTWVRINDKSTTSITLGQSVKLTASREDSMSGYYEWTTSDSSVLKISANYEKCTVKAVGVGCATITVSSQGKSDSIQITVEDVVIDEDAIITLSCADEDNTIFIGASTALTFDVQPSKYYCLIELAIVSGSEIADLIFEEDSGYRIRALDVGSVEIVATFDIYASNVICIEIVEHDPDGDPYEGVAKVDFYLNYTPATSESDAYYRTLHGFMSGSIEEQDQAPTIAEYQPMQDGLYLRNTSAIYGDNGKSYKILDAYGNVVNTIYKDAGYVSLEEVAAYVYAFSDIPANYVAGKKTDPQYSIWGEYLRLNHSEFSGNTTKYPYEPVLPRISGCGGDLIYFEIDIGTTGTDCDPTYANRVYNNGTTITRGAARIVYARFEKTLNTLIEDMSQRYVFYTYNHYNDFQEYLNYQGGWGKMFGNITGGGELSSKTEYDPTDYVETKTKDFSQQEKQLKMPHSIAFVIKRKIWIAQEEVA